MLRLRCLLGFHVWSAQTDQFGEDFIACQRCGETKQEPAPTIGFGNDFPGSWGQMT